MNIFVIKSELIKKLDDNEVFEMKISILCNLNILVVHKSFSN